MTMKTKATEIMREIIPLTKNDCFTIFSRSKTGFDFPLHTHDELELNLIQNAKGARRIIGDHIDEIDNLELVLVGPNLQHGWFNHHNDGSEIREITIQFHKDLFDEHFLQRNQMHFIKSLFEKSYQGILFSAETTLLILSRLEALTQRIGFDSVLELLSILHELSVSANKKILSGSSFVPVEKSFSYNSRRIENVMYYLHKNFEKTITLEDAAKITAMSEVAFSRFFKKKTGYSFVDTLNEIRLGHASRLLIDTTQSISEVAFSCGFNNISNFNRLFKKKKNTTPKAFRDTYSESGIRNFI
jgi:AraC-like DNA-binding protein